MEQKISKNLLPTLCHLCGMKPTRNLMRFRYGVVMARLITMYHLYNGGGGSGFSPLHLATYGRAADFMAADCKIDLVDGMYIPVNFIMDDTMVLVLPRCAAAAEIARVWAWIARAAMQRAGDGRASSRFMYILVNPTKITDGQTVVGEVSFDGVSEADIEATYEAFLTSCVTNDETDFDIEIELQGLRSRSAASRERIKSRMKRMGVSVLRGSKASVYLRKASSKCTVDLRRLSDEYPEAYKACVSGGKKYEFLTIKLNENE